MKKIFFMFIFLLFPLNIEAKNDEFIIECDKVVFKEFEDLTCRTKVNSSFNYDKISFEIETTNGISLVDARTNYTLLWKVTSKKNLIEAETKNSQLVNGYQEFGILLMSINEYGKQNIEIKNIHLTNSKEKETIKLDNALVDIKVESSENRLKEIKIDDKKIPKFLTNTYNYYVNVDSETLNIEAFPLDDNSKITGIGEIKLDPNVRVSVIPITVTSENGINRIYKLFVINDSVIEKDIKASFIELQDEKGNNIDINFRPDIYEYNIELNPNIKKITVKPSLETKEFSFVKGYGNQTIEIKNGDNLILIKIKDESGDIKTYVINVTKLLSNKSSNFYLKKLIIDGYSLKFNKKVKQYNLAIKKSDKSLNINAIPEDIKSIVNIVGNEDLTNDSIIKIIVKAENESKITYQIHITNLSNTFTSYIIFIIIALGLLVFFKKYNKNIIAFINKKKKKDIVKKQVKERSTNKVNIDTKNKPIVKKEESKIKDKVTKKTSDKKVTKPTSKKNVVKSKPKTTSTRVKSTKKKPLNKKTKKKISKNKKQNRKKQNKK